MILALPCMVVGLDYIKTNYMTCTAAAAAKTTIFSLSTLPLFTVEVE